MRKVSQWSYCTTIWIRGSKSLHVQTVILTFSLGSSCITAGLDLPPHCVYDVLWSNPWPVDVLHCHGNLWRPPWWLSQEFYSDLRSALINQVALVTTGDRVRNWAKAQLSSSKAHMHWFPGWTLRTANKTIQRSQILTLSRQLINDVAKWFLFTSPFTCYITHLQFHCCCKTTRTESIKYNSYVS